MKRRDFMKSAGGFVAGWLGCEATKKKREFTAKTRSVQIKKDFVGEITERRGKTYEVFSLGNHRQRVRARCKPIHFAGESGMEKIDSTLTTSSNKYLMDKNKFSVGFRKDRLKNKFFGVRKGENYQFEFTPRLIAINGAEVSIPDRFNKIQLVDAYSIDHVINQSVSLRTQVHEAFVRTAVKVGSATDFLIEEKIDLKGFRILNPFTEDKSGKTYAPFEGKGFLFQGETPDDLLWIPSPRMWAEGQETVGLIDHTLIMNPAGELVYSKNPTADGRDWLAKQIGVLLLDGTAYYAETSDGYIRNDDATWSGSRDATTGHLPEDSDSAYATAVMGGLDGSTYKTYRFFLAFDTSGIDDGHGVDTCVLNITGYGNNNADVSAQQGTQADTLVAGDFDAFSGSVYGTNTSWTIASYNDITFNATGCGDISNTGTTKICCREHDHDVLDSAPGVRYRAGVKTAEETGTSEDPYLDITTSASASGWSGEVAGVTNPAEVAGVDAANIQSVAGVE